MRALALTFACIVVFVLGFFLGASMAGAQSPRKMVPNQTVDLKCAPRLYAADVVERYQENRVLTGKTKGGWALVVFLNQKTGSWTVVMFHPTKDKACLYGAGFGGSMP